MHKSTSAFTIVEIAVVIVIISVLVTLTVAAYNTVQSQSRDTERKNDISLIKRALQKYYNENGEYPHPSNCADPGLNECWKDQWIDLLVSGDYLAEPLTPNLKATNAGANNAPGGNAYYGWYSATSTSYGIYVPLESGDCKTGVNVTATWWNSVQACDF